MQTTTSAPTTCPTCAKPLAGRGKCKTWTHALIGPRRVGDVIATDYGCEVVLEITPELADWRGWEIVVQDLDGSDAGRVRRHCTAWDGRRSQIIGRMEAR